MSFITQLPKEYLQPGKKEDLINLLRDLPIDYMPKKQALLEWGELTEVRLTQSDYQKLRETE